jgi:predicted MFS family arabinose efflux permease
VVGALAVMAGLGFGRFSYTILLPSTREGLGLTYTAAGFLATANLAGYLVGSSASGTIMQWLGPRATSTCALGVLALGLAWMGMAQGVADASLARALAGGAGAVVYVQALGLIAAWFPKRTRGLASGIMHSGNGLGLVVTGLGLPVMILTADNGWRAGWLLLGAASIIVVPLAWFCLRLPASQLNIMPDAGTVRGSLQAVQTASLTEYGIIYALFGLSYVIYVTFFAEILRGLGLPLATVGLTWAVVGSLSLGSGAFAGALSDRVGRNTALAVLFVLQGASYLVLIFGNGWPLVTSVVLFGTTAWGIPAVMAAAMSDIGRPEDAMAAFGRITAVMGVGQAIGPFLAGTLADATQVVESGLWISTGAAGVAVAWLILRLTWARERQRH